MRKNFHWFTLGLALFGLITLIFYNLFEIVEDVTYFPPSREAQINEYLALDRWLTREGYKIRVLNTGNINTLKTANEGTILIQPELFNWDIESMDYLEQWVEEGGSLILPISYYRNWSNNEGLTIFMDRLGVEADIAFDIPQDISNADHIYLNENDTPSFGRNIRFLAPIDQDAIIFTDENDAIRLLQLSRGNGKITVSSRPRYMTNTFLNEEINARLTWYLLAGAEDILFIRGERQVQSIMGRIFELGNITAIILSAFTLVVLSFWSVIPLFGVVKENEEIPGKALAERFLAEGLFLSRYKALDQYRARYFREIRRRLIKRENLEDEEIIPRAAALAGIDIKLIEQVLNPGIYKKKDFLRSVLIYKAILECL